MFGDQAVWFEFLSNTWMDEEISWKLENILNQMIMKV